MSTIQRRWMRLVVNGKAAGDPGLREAVAHTRDQGHRVEVRATWESGDAFHYAAAAADEGVEVVVAGGGDGTVNEVAAGLVEAGPESRTAMGVVPYGTANDFASGMGILKGEPKSALDLAARGSATRIDVGRVNDRIFVNVASGGFGAQVTASTPPELKKAIGGAAYSLMGVVTAAKLNPYDCKLILPDGTEDKGRLLLMAVGNGRQCGGGYQVTPYAYPDDGLLDVVAIHDVDISKIGLVLSEILDMRAKSNRFVTYRRLPSFSIELNQPFQMNLDGEPYRDRLFEFSVLPRALPFVLGPNAPLQPKEDTQSD
ncbi:MAG: lipid kinase YegS [Aeoliella sp.]